MKNKLNEDKKDVEKKYEKIADEHLELLPFSFIHSFIHSLMLIPCLFINTYMNK